MPCLPWIKKDRGLEEVTIEKGLEYEFLYLYTGISKNPITMIGAFGLKGRQFISFSKSPSLTNLLFAIWNICCRIFSLNISKDTDFIVKFCKNVFISIIFNSQFPISKKDTRFLEKIARSSYWFLLDCCCSLLSLKDK